MSLRSVYILVQILPVRKEYNCSQFLMSRGLIHNASGATKPNHTMTFQLSYHFCQAKFVTYSKKIEEGILRLQQTDSNEGLNFILQL